MAQTKGVNPQKTAISRLILAVVVAALLYAIFQNPQKMLSIAVALIGLAVVILVHEFGHFIVAKLCGMKVEVFSIGFGATVAGLQKTEKGLRLRFLPDFFPDTNDPQGPGKLTKTIGKPGKPSDTEYRLSLIPLGGYVKILGQEDVGSDHTSDDPNSYTNKPVWQRIAVVSAGVAFNFIFAAIIFMLVFSIGMPSPPPVVGEVIPGSPAQQAGLQPGDEIIEIKGQKAPELDFSDVMMAAALADQNQPVSMKVRKSENNVETVSMVARHLPGSSLKLKMFGISPAYSLTIGKVEDPCELKQRTSLIPGDKIIAVNNQPVEHSWQLSKIISQNPGKVNLTVQRTTGKKQTEEITTTITPSFVPPADANNTPTSIYGIVPRLKVANIQPRPENEQIKENDIIIEAGGVRLPTYPELRDITDQFANEKMPITVIRPDDSGKYQTLQLEVTPIKDQSHKNARATIGIILSLDMEHPVAAQILDDPNHPYAPQIPAGAKIKSIAGKPVQNFWQLIQTAKNLAPADTTITYQTPAETNSVKWQIPDNPLAVTVNADLMSELPLKPLMRTYRAKGGIFDAAALGARKAYLFIARTYLTLKALIAGEVGPENLIGPIGIVGAGSQLITNQDFIRYIWLMGMISAVLVVMNFLPIPVTDGGHVVLLIIEKIKGSPLNQKVIEIISYAGLALLIALFIFVTYNDLLRVLKG